MDQEPESELDVTELAFPTEVTPTRLTNGDLRPARMTGAMMTDREKVFQEDVKDVPGPEERGVGAAERRAINAEIIRTRLSKWLFWLFATTVLLGPIMIVGVTLLKVFHPNMPEFSNLVDKIALLATSVIGTVAGVFGSVMGFYFGREQANEVTPKG